MTEENIAIASSKSPSTQCSISHNLMSPSPQWHLSKFFGEFNTYGNVIAFACLYTSC